MDIHSLVSKLKEVERELGRVPVRSEFLKMSDVTDWQLRKITFNKVLEAAGMELQKNQVPKAVPQSITREPRILIFDIESVGMEVKTYSLKTDYISPKNILKDWAILSYAAKFRGEDQFHYLDQRYTQDKRDDRQVVEGLHELIITSDILIGHNIDAFDFKKFNTKAAKYGLHPIPPKITYDTLKIARKFFAVSSNSLSYLANFFALKSKKSDHGKYPGDSLWDACMSGDMEAWDENEAYNKQDVLVTDELFDYLSRYDSRINFQAFYHRPKCSCGSDAFHRTEDFSYTKQGQFRIYKCIECQKPFVSKDNLIDKDLRKEFFK
jgi:DNA polymerase elongation subunit (family B)